MKYSFCTVSVDELERVSRNLPQGQMIQIRPLDEMNEPFKSGVSLVFEIEGIPKFSFHKNINPRR